MSTEDENAEIVRILREWTVTKRELALRRNAMSLLAGHWSQAAQAVEKAITGDTADARMLLDQSLRASTMQHLDALEQLPQQLLKLERKLRDAGIELEGFTPLNR